MNKMYLPAFLLALMLASFFLPAACWAGAQIYDEPDTCTTTNCSALLLNGSYVHDARNNANPFVLQVYTAGNECVRIDVTKQQFDLEAVLVGPDGRIWRNDNRAAGDARPLIKAITPSAKGWCTLIVSNPTGEGNYSDFTFRYGRYNSNNPNCSSPTNPIATTLQSLAE